MAATMQQFTIEDCRAAIKSVLEAFKQTNNVMQLEEARSNAGNDMLKAMQMVFPLATQIQMDVISKYGFTNDGDGLIRFTQAMKVFEKQDGEMATLNAELKLILLPAMNAPPSSDDHETVS